MLLLGLLLLPDAAHEVRELADHRDERLPAAYGGTGDATLRGDFLGGRLLE